MKGKIKLKTKKQKTSCLQKCKTARKMSFAKWRTMLLRGPGSRDGRSHLSAVKKNKKKPTRIKTGKMKLIKIRKAKRKD